MLANSILLAIFTIFFAYVDAISSLSSKLFLYALISFFNSFIEVLKYELWFLNLKNLSLITLSSAAAAWNFKPLFVPGTNGTSSVFSIEPVPVLTVVIPHPPCSDTALSLSFFSSAVSNG